MSKTKLKTFWVYRNNGWRFRFWMNARGKSAKQVLHSVWWNNKGKVRKSDIHVRQAS